MMRLFVEQFEQGRVEVDGTALQHARVRRVQPGDPIELLNGSGWVGHGRIGDVGKRRLEVLIERIETRPQPANLDVFVPVADRDRMLLAAEKCAELQVTAWRPVYFARSRSVSPRGEGPKFRDKISARMEAALEQSGAAWMPLVADECEFAQAVCAVKPGVRRVLLDAQGEPMMRTLNAVNAAGAALMVGPEGGLDAEERRAALREGWTPAALTETTLRFETAIVSAVAVVRAMQLDRVRGQSSSS